MSSLEECLSDISQGCISGPHPTFFKKYFPNIDSISQSTAIKELENSNDGLSAPLSAHTLLSWLDAFSTVDSSPRRATWTPVVDFKLEVTWLTVTNLVLEYREESAVEKDHAWMNAQAVCHLSNGDQPYQSCLAQLYFMACQIFNSQPLRLSVHAVLVHGSVFEAWVFDKSGMYVSEPLSLAEDRIRVLLSLLQYNQKSPDDLGYRTFQYNEDNQAYITAGSGDVKREFILEENPFVQRGQLFNDGITCFRATTQQGLPPDQVIKFKWCIPRLQKEPQILRKAKEKGIKGAISLVHDESLASTPQLRSNIRALPFRTLLDESEENDGQIGLLRYSSEGNGQTMRRNDLLCLIYSPLGYPLDEFRSSLELVTVLRDAIATHRALLQDARILHRDISDWNIIISATDRRGILIDFDAAIDLSEEGPDEDNLFGTKHYMAIGLLEGSVDNYRFDLESFLYVLVWAITKSGRDVEGGRLMRWYSGDWDECARAKRDDMSSKGFELVLEEWTAEFEAVKPLARKLRDVLFRETSPESLVVEADMSDTGTNSLYYSVLGAFEESITVLYLNEL